MPKWLKSTELIKFEVKDRIARITLNRPEKRNAVSPQMRDELEGALLEADDLLEVNVIVLQGAGKDFCAGADLTAVYAGLSDEDRRRAEAEAARTEPATRRSTMIAGRWSGCRRRSR
jgi:enoyl-CoA hydratase